METRGFSAIAAGVIVATAFEPTTILTKVAFGIFGAAAGPIVGETIESEAVYAQKRSRNCFQNRPKSAKNSQVCLK
jgi:hypothetical protein